MTTSIPSQLNPLSPNGFQFSVQKLPDITFFCQQVNLPGINLGEPSFSTPFSTQPVPGDTLQYDPLTLQFLVDENMSNYKVLYNWIVALGFPESYEQYIGHNAKDTTAYSELAKNYSDATLQILDSNNQVVQTIQFYDVFPTTIESVMFASTNEDVQYVTGNVTFKFGWYKLL
jgi:hypothetical protein